MTKLLSSDIWKVIHVESRRAGPKRVAVAYAASPRLLRLERGDVVIANVSENAVRTAQTDAIALLQLHKKGVSVYNDPDLHAKVFILPHCVIVGSANLSGNSAGLREAAVLSHSGKLRREADTWFDKTRRGASRLNRETLERLAKIPVERWGGAGRLSQLPSLFEALENDHPILQDFVFSWIFPEGDLSTRTVRDAGRRTRILPGDIANKDWTWSEWPEESGLKTRLQKAYSGRIDICFLASADDQGDLARFTSVLTHCYSYMGSTRVSSNGEATRIVFDQIQRRAPGIRLSGAGWRRELMARLNAGLKRESRIRQTLISRETSVIQLSELKALFRTK